jgi:hypothetical protein
VGRRGGGWKVLQTAVIDTKKAESCIGKVDNTIQLAVAKVLSCREPLQDDKDEFNIYVYLTNILVV